jgi:hypothetical protein
MWRAVLISGLLLSGSARAVIVSGGDGSGNLTDLGNVTGWDYVGSVNGASGVYLGDYGGSYWVLTAGHVGAGDFTLDGVVYSLLGGSAVSLTNSDDRTVDLTLFRIATDPGLATLALSSGTPAVGTSVTMIGNGINRGADLTQWNVNWDETFVGVYRGYKWTGTSAKRWGKNTVSGTATNGTTDYLTTAFLQASGSAQATAGDSGGGVFTTVNGTLTLSGSMGLVSNFVGQPGSTSVYGNQTYSADISVYRTQILDRISPAPVPEPGVAALSAVGLAVFCAGSLRTRRAALR